MIITDREKLRIKSLPTTLKECSKLRIFEEMEIELQNSNIPGVGLSAIQIGKNIRASIIRTPKTKFNMINPVIIKKYEKFCFPNEGCLSLPGISCTTIRYRGCVAEWLDYNTEKMKKAAFYGFESVVIQHEVDHLDGILMEDVKWVAETKVGRNSPCPCGSGKKYKKCCLNN